MGVGRRPGRTHTRRTGKRSDARGTDRLEDVVAWVLTTCAAGVVLLAVAVGQLGAEHTLARSRAEAAVRTPARAELLEDVDASLVTDSSRPRTALVRWTAPDGRLTQGRVVVTGKLGTGDTVSVWMDRTGSLTQAPTSPANATAVGWTWGIAVALAGGAVLALAWTAVRTSTARRNAAAWAREWALVEPTWSGRMP